MKIIKFDFSLLQIMYILTQAWEIIVKHCGSFGTCAQSPKSSFISTVNWTKKVILRPRSPKIFLYENHHIQLFLTSNYPYFDPGFRNNCQTLWFSRYMPKPFKNSLKRPFRAKIWYIRRPGAKPPAVPNFPKWSQFDPNPRASEKTVKQLGAAGGFPYGPKNSFFITI